jgi:hypothetical protein
MKEVFPTSTLFSTTKSLVPLTATPHANYTVSAKNDTNVRHTTYRSREFVVPDCRAKISVASKLVPEPHTIADLKEQLSFWKYLIELGTYS